MALSRNGNKLPQQQVWYRPIKRDVAEMVQIAVNNDVLYAIDSEGKVWLYGHWPNAENQHVPGWVAVSAVRYEVTT